jgi:hypothetical protein
VASTVIISAAVPHHPSSEPHGHDRIPSPSPGHCAAASSPDITVWYVCFRFLPHRA